MHIIYCERQKSQLFFEPLNTISNIAFFFSAFYSTKYINENKVKDKLIRFLPYLLWAVGAGSMSYHSFRSYFTNYLDVIPIYLFIILSLFAVLRKLILKKNILYLTFALFGSIQLFSYFTFANFLYGASNYLITIFSLILMAMFIFKKYGKKLALSFVLIIGIFVIALFFRTIDFLACQYLPFGSHFLWHMLVGLSTYLGVRFLVDLDKDSQYLKH